LQGSHSEKKSAFMEGLSRMVGAKKWVWGMFSPMKPGEPVVTAGLLHGGFSAEELATYFQAIEHPDLAELNAPLISRTLAERGQVTRLQQNLDPDGRFQQMAVAPLWREAGLGPVLLSCYAFPDGCLSLTAFYRDASAAMFSQREARIIHILLSEVPWLHALGWDEAKEAEHNLLAPRLRTILSLLLEGFGRKQIAAHLEISVNTVSSYVKELYRFYDVHSQSELLRRFRFGNGGDLP